MNVLKMREFVEKKDLEEFNGALMNMLLKLQAENRTLVEKVVHLESLLMSVTSGSTMIIEPMPIKKCESNLK